MTSTRFSLAWAAVLVTASLGGAADLSKIERTIGKEPAYQGKPKYCLLVFGPEAKTRVWLVQDGDTLYVDRNANGDLTDKDERVAVKPGNKDWRLFEAGDIHDGALTHTKLTVRQFKTTAESVGNAQEFERIKRQGEPWVWTVGVSAERPADDKRPLPKQTGYIVNGDGLGMLLFGDRPTEAPVIHFNGPWSLGLQDLRQRLTAGHKSQLQIGVGTQGIGPGTFSFVLYPNTIPDKVYPEADITFPPKTPGEKPIRQKYTLKERC